MTTGNAKPIAHSRLYDGDTFEYRGHSFTVRFRRDDDMGEPWIEHDGHGIVSEWTTREKAPGERVLAADRSHKRYYDVQASIRLARKDQWGPIHCAVCGQESHHTAGSDSWETYQRGTHATETDHPFKKESAGRQAARAVDADFEYLRAWCNDEWEWTYVVVTELDTKERESLSGIDGDHDGGKYLTEVAYELADEIMSRIEVDEPEVQLSEN